MTTIVLFKVSTSMNCCKQQASRDTEIVLAPVPACYSGEKLDLDIKDLCTSLTAINLWLETDVFQLRKHCTVVSSSSMCMLIQLNFLLFSIFSLFVV
jgi:hypothetical protein